jgi:hypothetical protein
LIFDAIAGDDVVADDGTKSYNNIYSDTYIPREYLSEEQRATTNRADSLYKASYTDGYGLNETYDEIFSPYIDVIYDATRYTNPYWFDYNNEQKNYARDSTILANPVALDRAIRGDEVIPDYVPPQESIPKVKIYSDTYIPREYLSEEQRATADKADDLANLAYTSKGDYFYNTELKPYRDALEELIRAIPPHKRTYDPVGTSYARDSVILANPVMLDRAIKHEEIIPDNQYYRPPKHFKQTNDYINPFGEGYLY